MQVQMKAVQLKKKAMHVEKNGKHLLAKAMQTVTKVKQLPYNGKLLFPSPLPTVLWHLLSIKIRKPPTAISNISKSSANPPNELKIPSGDQ